MFILDDVSFKYQEPIFSHASIEIPEHKIGIVGENGIGKTTLLRLFNGELFAQSGKIRLDQRSYRFDFSFEKYNNFTIQDMLDIAKHMKAFDCSSSDSLIELLHIGKYMDTKIGKLSKGTAKKVGILLGMLTKDRVLLIDEPFESLDESTNQNLTELFRNSERQMMIVSHDMEYLKNSVEQIYEISGETLHVMQTELQS